MKSILIAFIGIISAGTVAESRELSHCSTESGYIDADPKAAFETTYNYVIKREFEGGSVEYYGVVSDKAKMTDDQAAALIKKLVQNVSGPRSLFIDNSKKDKVDPVVIYAPKDANDHNQTEYSKFLFSACKSWAAGDDPNQVANSGALSTH